MALVEALLLSLVLIVPLVWLLSMLSHVHRAAFATSAAAAGAGSAAARAADPVTARRVADTAVALAFADANLDMDRALLALVVPEGSPRGGRVQVEVRYPVRMIEVPLLHEFTALSVWVEAEYDGVIDPYSSRP